MRPTFTWLIAHTVIETLARCCQKCGQKQIVPEEKKNEAVPCQKCGESIPPKRI